MEQTHQIRIRNSECKMPKERRKLLTYQHWGLVSCELEETEDECIFTFFVDGLTETAAAKELELTDKYRLLANCADLEDLTLEYQFQLKPENLVYDRNLCVSVLLRDKRDELKESDFYKQYQALSAAILYPGYSFEEYYQGGNALYKKKRILNQLQNCQSTEELKEYLLNAWEEEEQDVKRNKKLVKRSYIRTVKIMIPLLGAVCLASTYMWTNIKLVRLPYQEKLLAAHSAYLSSLYIQVEDHLENISMDQLPLETQYILTRSYIYTEGLTPQQRDNLLAGISLNTDKAIFEFWIAVGRNDYVKAIDTAKRLGNDEFLLYAYIKQSAYTKVNTELSGEEKSELISKLEGDIGKLSESIAAEKENLNETTQADLEIGAGTQEGDLEGTETIEADAQGETDESSDIVQ